MTMATWVVGVIALSALALGATAAAPALLEGADASGHPTAETNGVPPGPASFLGDEAPYGPPEWLADGAPPSWLTLPEQD